MESLRYGSGSGSGYGSGYGDGSGSGSGYGYGDEIGKIGEYEVRLLVPWDYIQVGCEIHPIEVWQEQWRVLAARHEVEIPAIEAAALLATARTRVLGHQRMEVSDV